MTVKDLTTEFMAWCNKFGNRRNDKGLRFGQYICNQTGINDLAVYNEENATKAYYMLVELESANG